MNPAAPAAQGKSHDDHPEPWGVGSRCRMPGIQDPQGKTYSGSFPIVSGDFPRCYTRGPPLDLARPRTSGVIYNLLSDVPGVRQTAKANMGFGTAGSGPSLMLKQNDDKCPG